MWFSRWLGWVQEPIPVWEGDHPLCVWDKRGPTVVGVRVSPGSLLATSILLALYEALYEMNCARADAV